MEGKAIDESEFVTLNIPEYFVDDIAVRRVRQSDLLRVYCGTWKGGLFVPPYSVIVPIAGIVPMCRKLMTSAYDQHNLMQFAPTSLIQ